MIGWLSGKIIDKQAGKLVLNVQGVGYDVETSLQSFFQIENQTETISLHIHTIVREDALLLYGFIDKQERSLFRALLKVNGIGPKVAMSILSSASPKELMQSIGTKNLGFLTKLPGIGKKTAERLLIEMQDSIQQLMQENAGLFKHISETNLLVPEHAEAISALEALGYKSQDATRVVKKIDNGQKTCEQLIKEALQILATRV